MDIMIQYFIVGLLGAVIHSLFKIKSIQDKARLANVAFKWTDYWKEDVLSHLISLATIVLCMFFVYDILAIKPEFEPYIRIGFAFVGYTGNDIASRIFGAANKRVNQIIDQKTTIADKATGETQPTPHK